MRTIVEKFINEICLDERLVEGMFFIDDNNHMDILQEHLQNRGLSEEEAIEMRNKVVEGRFPERQAYNKMGLLVTFPTPEYKKRALDRGTHFEQDPTKQAPNVKFDATGAPVTPPAAPAAPTAPAPAAPTAPAAPAEAPPTPSPAPAPPPAPTAAPTPAPAPVPTPAPVATEPPIAAPSPEPPTVSPTPAEAPKEPGQKKAESEYVEKILKS